MIAVIEAFRHMLYARIQQECISDQCSIRKSGDEGAAVPDPDRRRNRRQGTHALWSPSIRTISSECSDDQAPSQSQQGNRARTKRAVCSMGAGLYAVMHRLRIPPEAQLLGGGTEMSVDALAQEVLFADGIESITISGGEPFLQVAALVRLIDTLVPGGIWA